MALTIGMSMLDDIGVWIGCLHHFSYWSKLETDGEFVWGR